MSSTAALTSRITHYSKANPAELIPNPLNFRMHPQAQAEALDAIIDEVGSVAPVIVNDVTGHVIDGHLRIERGIARREHEIDVAHVELTEEEERKILATFDPLGALAETNAERLRELLAGVRSDSGPIQQMLRDLAEREGLNVAVPTLDDLEAKHPEPPDATFWPEIKLKVPMRIFQQWQRMMEGVPGNEEHLRLLAILEAAERYL